MAAPIITLSLESALSGSVDLTALSGGDVGYTKNAYYANAGFGAIWKFSGPPSLEPTQFGAGGTEGTYFWSGVTADVTDSANFGLEPESRTLTFSKARDYTSATGTGLQYDMAADRDLAVFQWQGITGGGGYQVNASLSDSSYTSQTLSLPSDADGSFSCTFRALEPDATCTIQIEKIGATSGYIAPRFVWLTYTPRRRAKGLNMFYRSVYR